jgi:hypothetical protein
MGLAPFPFSQAVYNWEKKEWREQAWSPAVWAGCSWEWRVSPECLAFRAAWAAYNWAKAGCNWAQMVLPDPPQEPRGPPALWVP